MDQGIIQGFRMRSIMQVDTDTVFVYHGTYYENVDIDKIINLIGEDKNTTIIDGGGKHDVICIHNDNDGVTVSGFTILAQW